jgi:DNA (cytosine-5)-methyltransferase 1
MDPTFIVVDLFCGAGGTTTGFSKAKLKPSKIFKDWKEYGRVAGFDDEFAKANFTKKFKAAEVVACVNHDYKAIESHWLNHPEVEHFTEDITKLYGFVYHRTLFMSSEMRRLVRLVNIYRAFYPNAKVILWASLECTNFSKAKGGQARDADSRTLAEHLSRYVGALNPDYVQIENVVEFMSWGPLTAKVVKTNEGYPCCKVEFVEQLEDLIDEDGKYIAEPIYKGNKVIAEKRVMRNSGKYKTKWHGVPESTKSGLDWLRWRKHLCEFGGYRDEWRELNSADFGAYTSRNRLFGIFAKPGLPIIWPEPSHSKKPGKADLFNPLQKWKPVREVLDLQDEGSSIFNRKKSLVDASLERIYAGLIKFVAGGKEAFILKYNSKDANGKHHPPSIDSPCPTIACQNRLGIVNATFLAKYYSGHPASKTTSLDDPAGTIKCRDGQSIVNALFLQKHFSGKPEGKVIPVDGPAGTVCTNGNQSLVSVLPWVMNTNFKNIGHSINDPAQTLTASRHHPYVVSPTFLMQYYSNGGELASIEEPGRTLGTKDTIAKIQTNWFDKTFTGSGNVSSIEQPAGTLMPCDKHRLIQCEELIMNPSHGGHSTSIFVPCPTIVARQDKAPLYLIKVTVAENVHIPVYDSDSDVMVRIKIFMALYGISDIKMRMLKVSELLRIQGFPSDYKLHGNQTDQKKFIGNSVAPIVPKRWSESLAIVINENQLYNEVKNRIAA